MTPRPGRIDLIEEIDIPRPRTWDLLGSERFGHYVEVLRNMFRSQGVLCDARNLSGLSGPNECRTTPPPSSLPYKGEG